MCGTSEIPAAFHLWSCIALIAACVGDRVFITKFKGKKLAPNLYVTLLGPSGLGKGEAIDTAVRFVHDIPRVNVYSGRATMQAIMRRMGRPRRTQDGKMVLDGSKLFLVTPELSMAVGKGERADSLIKGMTEMYTGRPYPVTDDAITREVFTVTDYCLNWIAGTTLDWLVDCVPKDAISGGFFGRMIAVHAEYDFATRIHEPQYPPDYGEVVEHLHARIRTLTRLEGAFTVDREAIDVDRQWYTERPEPEDMSLAPAWKRAHDLVLKLAMVLSLADDADLVIRRHHVIAAQKFAARVYKTMPELISSASVNPETVGLAEVAKLINRVGAIRHATLLKMIWRRGINAERLKMITETLVQSRQIVRSGDTWTWTDKRRIPEASTNGGPPETG